ncbi:SusC/RagA family TonB-linked outer membrane protein [Coprobacter secundus]|uniref:SusC/RagA family TonB-linked outer membrane protein n=1 Tax=Coprobacter secundus subsp. similis TaxID=2751153 RepID=A0A7G1HZB4_9BACT|nr:TonB-dependent receptor [Coprobacter secundus]BCI63784.1 SusC/RagA family TonB-linked outer membrane protein [Coprobacter secundus subsp. similis]
MRKKSKPEKLNHKVLYLSICLLFVGTPQINAAIGKEDKSEAVVQKAEIIVTGTIKDSSGEPLVGASVAIPKSAIGTIADYNGKFTLKVPEGTKTVMVSCVGFVSQTLKLDGKNTFSITLQETTTNLNDVVVVGYSSQKKETVTGAVAAIQTKDLLQSPQANISNALVGRMPGLLAVQRSGEPGKDQSTLRIRGIGTFAGEQDPLVLVDGIETSNYDNIDPNEIESVSILKDASATAVYGVRGANGVLIITTKRGELGRPKVSLSTSVGRASFTYLRENMNSYEYTSSYNKALMYDSYVTGGYTPKYSDEDIELYRTGADPIFHPSIDWFDEMLKKASYQTRTNLNISGGTERVKYFFSLGYFTQNGMYNTALFDPGYDPQLKYRRYNMRSNFDIQVTKRLKASFDFSVQMDNRRYPNWDTPLFMEMLSSTLPYISPGIIDNKIVTMSWLTQTDFTPYAAFNTGFRKDYGNNLNGSIRLNYDLDFITKGLGLRGAISYRNYNTQAQTFNRTGLGYEVKPSDEAPGYVLIPSGELASFQYGESVAKNRRIYIEIGAEYSRQFGGHNIGILALYNQSKYHSPDLAYLIPNGYQGLVGRITYNYKNRYLAEFNIGYNGTENFDKGNRFGTFPAYSLGWVPTEEDFFPRNPYVSFFKIRGSYGEVGNDKVGGDRFLYRPTSYSYTNNSYFWGIHGESQQGYQGANEGKLGNPDLTWEKAKKTNVGADIKFWDDHIGFTFDWFKEKRSNILCNRGTIPNIIGADFPAYNLGRMTNKGIELELTFNHNIGDFYYFIKANYTYAHNIVDYKDEANWDYDYRYETGHRYGQSFGYVADGLFNSWEEVNDPNRPVYQWNNNKIQPGDIRYKDINGDGKIDNDDQVPIGYSNFPEKIFGLSLGGNYKGFDFSLLFQGAANVSTWPSRRSTQGFYTNTAASKDLLNSWSEERLQNGEKIIYPRLSASNNTHNYVGSTYWLEDASYVRLKNAEIGYTIRNNFLKKVGISSVRFYLNGNNLLTWCDLFPGEDPEFPNGSVNSEPYPVTRIYNFGVNINF